MALLNTIKLVVWDLDDTFWKGTISEGPVEIVQENLQLVKDLTDCGIMNSICSKNDYDVVDRELTHAGIRDYFVFPSINWESKSARLKSLIERMSLRPVNVLFIDDNHFNLEEARHLMPELQILSAECISEVRSEVGLMPRSDMSHKRLGQYKVLEKKRQDEQSFSSNEEFLFSSDIRVIIREDCICELDRIYELVQRSNQLNFTKKRDSREELENLIKDETCRCGYVSVKDKYGDYGIVGFYALRDGFLEHFVFSCRTMGQGIEQYVYAVLGSPEINVVGEVRTVLKKGYMPEYINQAHDNVDNESESRRGKTSLSILMKGPCDMSHALMYLNTNDNIDTEFTYVKAGTNKTIDAYNHSVHIIGLKNLSENQVKEIIHDCPFVDSDMFNSSFFKKNYDVIFLSSLIESVRGIYQKKGTDIRVAFGPRNFPMTDPSNWPGYVSGSFSNGNSFSYDFLKTFSEKYEYVGATTPLDYSSFLEECLHELPDFTNLCVILGATWPIPGCEAHAGYHEELNNAVIRLAESNKRLRYIKIDDLIDGEKDLDGSIDHFTTQVYYKLANAMADVIEAVSGVRIEQAVKSKVYFVKALNVVRSCLKRVLREDCRLYTIFKMRYLSLTGKKDIVK